MTLWTSEEAVQATGGRSTTGWQAHGVSIDTRTIEAGDLFVALKDVRDGHDFVAKALEVGAAAALVSRVPEGVREDAPLLIVDDVLPGLENLGRAARARTQAKVIGVTGSVGKTSTKEMLRTCLGAQGRVHAAEKSYNNHWGVPLTLARMPADSEYAVIEIGMNHPGEIAPLSRLADLDVALITIVAPAHLEAFDNIEGIAREKASIFEGLRRDGVAILNGDLEVSDLLASIAPQGALRFGHGDDCTWRLLSTEQGAESTVCKAAHAGEAVLFKLAAPGKHFAMNGLAALSACVAAGADLGQSVIALGRWQPPQGRGRRHFVQLDAVHQEIGIDLFDDAYNANPASVGAALDVVSFISPPNAGGRRVAILGDMKELGQTEAALHAELARLDAMERIDLVHCVGPLMRHLFDALPPHKRGIWAERSAELAASPSQLVQAGDVVMAKGSLSMKMALIVDAITNLGQAIESKDRGHR
ncbi:MAG: UDP-N-acetylmuramoyl-tripeptide--D-alanyl-D-alanine ligase [Pseudomonadota bacterium]